MNYKAAYERLLRSMNGIAANATRCGSCEMMQRVAAQAAREAPELLQDVPTDRQLLDIPDFLRKCDD